MFNPLNRFFKKYPRRFIRRRTFADTLKYLLVIYLCLFIIYILKPLSTLSPPCKKIIHYPILKNKPKASPGSSFSVYAVFLFLSFITRLFSSSNTPFSFKKSTTGFPHFSHKSKPFAKPKPTLIDSFLITFLQKSHFVRYIYFIIFFHPSPSIVNINLCFSYLFSKSIFEFDIQQ